MSAPATGASEGRRHAGAGAATLARRPTDQRLRELIREIPDFPGRGSASRTSRRCWPIAGALADAVALLADYARPLRVDCVVAAEARGFLLGPALALELGAGFVLARKPGKLPYETISAEYLLEYGAGQLELHTDAVHSGTRVLIHDDLLATGGTAKALCELVEAARRRGRGVRVPDRARLPSRPRAARAARRARAAHLRVLGLPACPPRVAAARSPRPSRSCGR